MATMARPQAPAGMPPAPGAADASSSRFSRWRASWAVALRMARRDLRRHKGRAVLVFLMVAIPVGLIACAATLGATEQTDPGDLMTARMGSGQALLHGPEAGRLQQLPDPDRGGAGWDSDHPAVAIPGYRTDATPQANAAALGRLVGGTVTPAGDAELRWLHGELRTRLTALVVDPRGVDLGGKARLTGGHWATSAGEVAVTAAGIAKGLPSTGTIQLSAIGTEHQVTIVGTAEAFTEWGGRPDMVMSTPPEGTVASGGGPTGWVVTGRGPVSWAEVQQLNTFGLTVFSRAVLDHPPPDSALPEELRQAGQRGQEASTMIAVIGGVMLFLLTTLLVGPAFAVSASRQRRTLALAATNGAEVRQLRRTVLAQAVLLGAVSAVGGVVLGMLTVRVGLWWWVRTHPSSNLASASLDVPWKAFAILLPCAVLSAVVAALVPSMRLGRLDVIGVMRGQSVSPPLNRWLPLVGAVLAAVGSLVIIGGARQPSSGEMVVAMGATALVLGALMVVPALLVLAGAAASRLPVAPRMATRDAARHRTRSSPTVAAILAGVAALTTFSIALASDTAQRMADYVPQQLPGEGLVWTSDPEVRLSVESALRQFPQLVQTPVLKVRGGGPFTGPSTQAPVRPQPFVSAVAPGCTQQQALPTMDGPEQCQVLGTAAYNAGEIAVLPLAELTRRLHLTSAQETAVARGAVVVATSRLRPASRVEFLLGSATTNPATGVLQDHQVLRRDLLPVVRVDQHLQMTGAMPSQTGAAVTPETAQRLGWPTQQEAVMLRDPDGAIGADTAQRLDELVGDEAGLYVERGFQREDKLVMAVMAGIAAVLVLIVTLIATALSLAEQQSDLGTLAAVGATRRTRRGFAAAQATVTGLMGAMLGVVVGLVPGIAVTYPLTSTSWDQVTGEQKAPEAYLVIPWQPLLLVVLGVPVLAGLLSALAIRTAPLMTRRAD